MTSRERILAALRREEVDYVPCCAIFNPLREVYRKGHQWNFPWSPGASLDERLAYQIGELGLDQVVGVGVDLRRPDTDVKSKTWLDGDILHKVYTTPAGDLHASVQFNELWPCGKDIPFYSDFNVSHFVEPWIQNESDLECFMYVAGLCDTAEVLEEGHSSFTIIKSLAEKYNIATMAHVGTGLTGAMQLFGASELCMMTVENAELVEVYLEYEHQLNLRTLEVLGEFGVDIIRRNGFYETADFYGPDMLVRFVGRRISREAECARVTGMLSSYTVHTGLMPILDYLAELTVDSFFGIDIAFKDMDIRILREKLAPKKSFWIGPSSTFHIEKGPDVTRAAVREVFDVFGKTGLILAPCVSAHSIMPWESTLSMIDEWKKLR